MCQSHASHVLITCPSIMYEIIIIESLAESGNFSGSLVVSISKARTTGSWEWGNGINVCYNGWIGSKTNWSVRFLFDQSQLGWLGATPPHVVPVTNINLAVDGHSDVIWNIILSNVENILHLVS